MANTIIANTGTNYSLYYNVINYFKTIMSNHPSINAVTQGDITKIDVDQFPSYPLGNILITESNFGSNITNYTIQLTVADKIKNKNNESSGSLNQQSIDYFKGVDDTIDIHNNTLGILNDLTSYTQRGVQAFDIDGEIGRFLATEVTSTPILFKKLFGSDRGIKVKSMMGLTDIEHGANQALSDKNNLITEYTSTFKKRKANELAFNDELNIYERGMLSFLKRHQGGADEQIQMEFNRRKEGLMNLLKKIPESFNFIHCIIKSLYGKCSNSKRYREVFRCSIC